MPTNVGQFWFQKVIFFEHLNRTEEIRNSSVVMLYSVIWILAVTIQKGSIVDCLLQQSIFFVQ